MIRTLKLAFLIVAVTGGLAQAGPITIVPTSLAPGDSYRLAFVTSATRDATSSNIADYNVFVDTVGDTVFASDWRAIVSTAAVDARDNTNTRPSSVLGGSVGVPIFLLNDTLLVDNYDDLWDGSLDRDLNITQLGDVTNVIVWTGTGTDGVASLGLGGGSLVTVGASSEQGTGWVDLVDVPPTSQRSFYALSGLLSAPGVAVPEPGSVTLALMGAVGMLGYGSRRKRKRANAGS